jgi:hypothetical protein
MGDQIDKRISRLKTYIRRTRGYFRRGSDAWIRREGKGTRLEVFHRSLPLLGQGPRFIEHSSRIKLWHS